MRARTAYATVWVLCLAVLLGGEPLRFLFAHEPSHGFAFESWPGFYAFFGFVACVALVLAAKELRKLVMRDESYYDERDGASDDVD